MTPDEFAGRITTSQKKCTGALGITVLSGRGSGADDTPPATLLARRPGRSYRVLVVTGDRDALQLVSDDVTVLLPHKGVSELTRFTPEGRLCVEKYRLT